MQCGPDLVSEAPVTTCSNQACVNGACAGVCIPGATACSANAVQTCAADGSWQTTAACAESCSDGGCTTFPSCQGGGAGAGTDCGPRSSGDGKATNDCCLSYEVGGGGNFYRSYDGVSPGDTNKNSPVTVSGFRFDAYEITVGRLRKFVSAAVGGWRPAPGSGKHSHLNGGSGLAGVGTDAASSEPGWIAAWSSSLATTLGAWNSNLACDAVAATWTSGAAANERRPANCITWYEAYAFCIWDGGFLPSEAEWNFAASGGTDQRVYPWSVPPAAAPVDCSHANFTPLGMPACSSTGPNDVGSESMTGDGKFGQSDLSGNVGEWNLDSFAAYVYPCNDCANVSPGGTRVARGGSFALSAAALLTSYRGNFTPTTRDASVGARCARVP
jgi:sulfatase modifying factor 1